MWDRQQTELQLKEAEEKYRSILDNMDNIGIGVALISPKMEILDLNRRIREWFPAIDPGQRPICYRVFDDPPREAVCDDCPARKALQDGLAHESTTQKRRAGMVHFYRIVSSPILNVSGKVSEVIVTVEDITEKLSLESQLWQAEKMESVGRLAGGLAHDLNNMLGVIIGHAELAMEHVGPAQPVLASLQEIRKAAVRSANLTRQLQAFARQQPITPRMLDMNEAVEGTLRMLGRLIGEDIDLVWVPGPGLCRVKVDPSQIDEILANLCLNARNAMAGVSKITIETHKATIDEAYCAKHREGVPGRYVLLKVSDDGGGMDKKNLDRLSEPFFTTKDTGKGTGPGLAMVYSMVRQNNGFINVYSEIGHGTTFKIYLPREAAQTEQTPKQSPVVYAAQGHETILLVEDEPGILDMTKRMLERLGYKVLPASTPGEAIRAAKDYFGQIHLLLTDVVMPEMNGWDLSQSLLPLYPGIGSLFMSGYTGNVIAHQGVMDKGIHFIQKPFSIKALAAKVRETLDGR
jgi:two-component system cell cycle sensor histidine kinase/response regulator CckA